MNFRQLLFSGLLTTLLVGLTGVPSSGQLIINTNVTAQQMVATLLGCSSVASNINMNCGNGASAKFIATNTNLGIDSGIVFTSGQATNAIGPNNGCCDGTNNLQPGNANLTALCGQPTFDACILDFDVLLNTDTLRFNYVFGSDEYSEWVGTIFNDVFALWISGPGIVGQKNMAIVPGTSFPVTISNVNCTIGFGAYYVCNEPANFICPPSYNCPTSQAATTIEYDGLTKVLEAKYPVTPGQTYHLTFAIADAGDGIYDSGVFVEADFLEQYDIDILSDTFNFINPFNGELTAVEGCKQGVFNFVLNTYHTDTLFIPIVIGGTAVNGVDYLTINDTLVFLPYDSLCSVFIGAYADGIPEGTETIILYTIDPCSGLPVDSMVMYVIDDFPFEVSGDTTICEQGTAQLGVTYSPFYSYHWEPAAFVSCPDCHDPLASPMGTTVFTVSVSLDICTNEKNVTVQVDVIEPDAGPDQQICWGDTIQLLATGGTAYSWSPATGLSDTNVANPFAFPATTTEYIVTVQGTYPPCFDYDTMRITVVPHAVAEAGVDTAVCSGMPVQLWASGGVTYEWTPTDYLDFPNTASPVSTPFSTTVYEVLVTNQYGCQDSVEVTVEVFPDPVITVNQPYEIYAGEEAQLFAHCGVGSSYEWNPPTFLTDHRIYNPVSRPTEDISYTVRITTAEGCVYFGSTYVKIIHDLLLLMPNAFTPNGDGINDQFRIIYRGPFRLNQFSVFDRWGNTLFATSDPDFGWDGSYNGRSAEIGTYVYVVDGLDGNGNSVLRKGSFTLFR
ncbi:MAG: choice-of-anchor L domain-containing protein [Chitinophagales bacterium]|nr:gliding motility-associated C-terminal domain-containing protein [Chitinophagales bacterium]MDW8394284.1 choice-of-anchor L domain-containing protein [Chitinophagales bacterium]